MLSDGARSFHRPPRDTNALNLTPGRGHPILAREGRTLWHVEEIVVIGGPNGAGKTTAAQLLVPRGLEIREFVNADEIARGLSPFNADHAARLAGQLMLERIGEFIRNRQSFAFETTCAGRAHVGTLRRCRAEGWRITLVYLWLPSPQMALDRVARRVREGGHHIPDEVVIRRYWAGLSNMRRLYLPVADVAAIYDNSDGGRTLIAQRMPGGSLVVHDAARWAKIEEARP
jgi:predicted ABC-type ATPase